MEQNNNKKTVEKRTSIKNSIGRLLLIALLLLVQLFVLTTLLLKISSQYALVDGIFRALALLLVLEINRNEYSMSLKSPFMILILVMPVAGVLIYLLLGINTSTGYMRRRFKEFMNTNRKFITQEITVIEDIDAENREAANMFRYVSDYAPYPVYHNTDSVYYSRAEDSYDALLKDLSTAKKYIFMEYHAIENKESFAPILNILVQKVTEGVDVRILYDDIGSFVFINNDFIKMLNSFGIKCRAFNPMMPFFNLFLNNRDHRKITIIDGVISHTGGYNIANEYFNITHPYGHWKDCGIRITGGAVNNFVYMFLEMWNSINKYEKDADSAQFFMKNAIDIDKPSKGYISPFADSPIDMEPVGENVYLNILTNADYYCWFITPYLILSDELKRAFQLAVKRGVDVRIIIPGIPDKNMTYRVTHANVRELLKCGVKIYKYTPGFCHSKLCVADDLYGVCGTINLDYRSLYHHFENGVLMYNTPSVMEIKKDIEDTFEISKQIPQDYKFKTGLIDPILRLLSPLL